MGKTLTLISAMIAVACPAFTGCMSDKAASDFGREFGLAIRGLVAPDLLYSSESFRNKTGRWPKDYAELAEFVRQSDGYLSLRHYERVELTQLPEDVLQISFVPSGCTNEMKLKVCPRSNSR